jgi:hypothetical protein
MSDEESPEHEAGSHPRRDFVIAYLFWVVVFISIAASIWLSSSDLSAFRYAGF